MTRNSARNAARPWKRRSELPGWECPLQRGLQILKCCPVWHDTSMFRLRNSNIPHDHANLQGTTVNQSTITTSQASQTATTIRRTSRPFSLVHKAVHVITDELGVTFQIDRTSTLPTRSRETQLCSSISANRTPDSMPRHQSMTLITATRTSMPVELRKCHEAEPSPTLSFPATVIRVWRIDR